MKAIIFDMDGVIIDSQSIANRLLKAACKKLGVCLTKKELSDLTGASGRRFWSYVKQTYNLPEDVDYYRSLYNVDLEINEYQNLSVDKDLINLLEFLNKNKIKIAIATSSSKKRMEAVLGQFGIKKYFTVRVCDNDVSKSKPDPEIYLLTAEKLGVNPHDCAVIEDTDSGILASTKAGMKCYLFIKYTPIGDLSDKAVLTFNDFSILKQKIKPLKTNFITDNYLHYIEFLKKLAAMPSVFSNPKDVEKAIQFCKKTFETNLNNHSIYFDDQHNIIALPKDINFQEDIVYLSAHIDTVDANFKEWDQPFYPWKVYEDEKEIVARGVSDCKAGVAYQLFLSYLAKKKFISLKNLVFTITYKEEGSGKKTATEIAKEMGKKLPMSNQTYLIVLENNVSVNTLPTLSIYAAERTNFVIKITDFIPELQKYLLKLSHWNPVSIKPQIVDQNLVWQTQKQAGGHVCSVNRENNLLTKTILEAKEKTVIEAGDERNFSVVPTVISTSQVKNPTKHSLVISNRSFDSIEEVLQQLQGIEYRALKDFSISEGFNAQRKFKQNKISKILEDCKDESELKLEYTYNTGGSDATEIYTSVDSKIQKNIFPIVMGPGSRSQRGKSPQRLTHGKNETYDKESGKRTIIFITKVLEQLNCIK